MKVNRKINNRFLLLFDAFLCIFAYLSALVIVFPLASIFAEFSWNMPIIFVTTAVYLFMFLITGLYRIDWIYTGAKEYLTLILACIFSASVSVIAGTFMPTHGIYPKLNIVANGFIVVFLCGVRFSIRLAHKILRMSVGEKRRQNGKRTLVIGAGNLAVLLLRDIAENENLNFNVVGLIDDDPAKRGVHIYNTKVLGNRNDIIRICGEEKIEEIIFAIQTLSSKQRMELLDICSETGIKVRILSGVEQNLCESAKIGNVREIEIEDLLERDPISLDNELIENDICGKTVLVTGGGGSIGSELCRQILRFKPKRLVIVDIYENTTYEVQNELVDEYPDIDIDVLIASVRDKVRLDYIFSKYKPDIVFHAAAHKHVPLMEFSPVEAIKNNVFGTYNTAVCAEKYNVKRFVLISTDKAVNPTNIMGATKRMCEMIVQTLQKDGKTEFVAVRFGNVLGSHGSVVPRFKAQIEAGGPVTVTHPDITRFFMTIPEAAQLVLQAAAYAKGGEIFVLDMGKPVRIYDMAKKMIKLYGYKPDEDIDIVFTGLREGEKLYEELLMDEEGLKGTGHSKIFVGQPIDLTVSELDEKLEKLKTVINSECQEVREVMHEVVPTYSPADNCPTGK